MSSPGDAVPCLCPLTTTDVPATLTCPHGCAAELPELCHAIGARRVVRFIYNGYLRVVEPHAYFVTTKGHQVLRAFQRNYGGLTPQPGWHVFRVDMLTGFMPTTITFPTARMDYSPNDRLMQAFFVRLPEAMQ